MSKTAQPPEICAIAIIPARFSATRLPGKPLLDLCGKPMIVRTIERAMCAPSIVRALVATDDERIYRVVNEAGYEAVMTSSGHQSGTDRLAEVAQGLAPDAIVVNVQGDEPLISPLTIELAINALLLNPECSMATTYEPLSNLTEVLSPDVVKVVIDSTGRALLFSRSPIPFPREAVRSYGSLAAALKAEPALCRTFRKHTGLYVYRREFLLDFAGWEPTPGEKAESLEQLRALECGSIIQVVEAAGSSPGVDTLEDLNRARVLLQRELMSPAQ